MTVTLLPYQEARIMDRVANGDFASVEEAARQLIAERIEELAIQEDDMAWAKPYVDEALAEVERGEVMTREENQARIEARFASMT